MGRSVTIVDVYARNDNASVQVKDSFEGDLRNGIDQISHRYETLIQETLIAEQKDKKNNNKIVRPHRGHCK